jgi:hypothetical protein
MHLAGRLILSAGRWCTYEIATDRSGGPTRFTEPAGQHRPWGEAPVYVASRPTGIEAGHFPPEPDQLTSSA